MSDYAARYTDRAIRTVERRLRKTYNTAAKELAEKLADFNRRFSAKDKLQRSLVKSGLLSEDDYKSWMKGQLFMKGQLNDKIRQVSQILMTHNRQAQKIVRESQIDTFVENYNFSAFLAEKGTGISFNIYNTESVAQLIKKKPKILPEWTINEKKDYKWCYNKVNNIIRQGIIQGESIPEITKRLATDLSAQSENKMRTFARTAMTEAQNSGRQQQMEDVADDGVEVMKEWVATLDDRTRDEHRMLDGQRVPYDQPFKVGKEEIDYPGDPKADPSLVYNCRCTMVTVFPKYEEGRRNWREGVTVGNKSYEDWKAEKRRKRN